MTRRVGSQGRSRCALLPSAQAESSGQNLILGPRRLQKQGTTRSGSSSYRRFVPIADTWKRPAECLEWAVSGRSASGLGFLEADIEAGGDGRSVALGRTQFVPILFEVS